MRHIVDVAAFYEVLEGLLAEGVEQVEIYLSDPREQGRPYAGIIPVRMGVRRKEVLKLYSEAK